MPLWVRVLLATAAPEEVAEVARAHRDQLRELRREGRLRIAGELGDEDGWIEVFEAEDRLAAERLGESSPLVEAGLVSWTVRPWSDALPDDSEP